MARKSAKKTAKGNAPSLNGASSGGLLKDKAYDSIKEYILSNGLRPGTFMSIGEVAGWFNMSKTPIREAFQRLETEGFVTISPQQGIAIRGVSLDEIMELFDIRSLLEGHVVKRLAGRLTSNQVAELSESMELQEEACRAGNVEDVLRLDREFHAILYRYNGNSQIQALMENARDKIFSVLGPLYGKVGDLRPIMEQHQLVVDALFSGDSVEAGKKMRAHLKYWQKLALFEQFSSLEEDDLD